MKKLQKRIQRLKYLNLHLQLPVVPLNNHLPPRHRVYNLPPDLGRDSRMRLGPQDFQQRILLLWRQILLVSVPSLSVQILARGGGKGAYR